MTIRFEQSLSGPGGVWSVGEFADFPDAEGARLCEAGIATPVVAAPEAAEPAKEKRTK